MSNLYLADLCGSQYLFEILHISLTVKSSENLVKIGRFENTLRWKATMFFQSEVGI